MLARFVYISSTDAVDFYTIEVAEHDEAAWTQLLDRFLNRGLVGPGAQKARTIMQAWLINIGRYGIDRLVLRDENDADAIPPKRVTGRQRAGDNAQSLLQAFRGLPAPRLYFARFGRALILLDGGMKTVRQAQSCPIVAPKFELANRICRSLDRLLERGDLRILRDGSLEIPDELVFSVP